jgi:hypothetical protein
VLDLAATKAGRSLFALVYIRPAHSVSARDLDRIRDAVQTGGESAVARIRTEVAFTERSPLRDGAPASPSDE